MRAAPGSPLLAFDPRRLSPAHLAVVLVAAGAVSACDVTIKDGDVSISQAEGRASQEWSRRYSLTDGGTIEVANTNGPIDVSVGAEGTVDVAVMITARAMTDEGAKDALAQTAIDEQVAPDHVRLATRQAIERGRGRDDRGRGGDDREGRGGDRGRGFGGPRRGGVEVAYKLTVPAGARVVLNAATGRLKVTGVKGAVKVLVGNGAVDLVGLSGSVDAATSIGPVMTQMAGVTDRIRLESANGRVSLAIPADARATLDARAVNGGITVTGLTAQESGGRRIRTVESQLNGGGPPIEIRVTNGGIAIEGK